MSAIPVRTCRVRNFPKRSNLNLSTCEQVNSTLQVEQLILNTEDTSSCTGSFIQWTVWCITELLVISNEVFQHTHDGMSIIVIQWNPGKIPRW